LPQHEEPIPDALRGIVEPYRFLSGDGSGIGAWYAEGNPEGASVLLVHGNWGSRSQLAGELLDLHGAGHSVLSITVRAHGDSDGFESDVGYGARLDVLRGVEFLRGERPGKAIVVYGASMGAAAALHAARALGSTVRAYVLAAPYASLREAVRRRCARYLPPGLDSFAYATLSLWAPWVLPHIDRRPVDAARSIPESVPVLAIVGEEDDRAPPSDAAAILANVRSGRLVTFPGLSHVSLHEGDPERWRGVVLPFVARLGWEAASPERQVEEQGVARGCAL
jgi:pimeloyl-ACP methyl ester carboxylesterase